MPRVAIVTKWEYQPRLVGRSIQLLASGLCEQHCWCLGGKERIRCDIKSSLRGLGRQSLCATCYMIQDHNKYYPIEGVRMSLSLVFGTSSTWGTSVYGFLEIAHWIWTMLWMIERPINQFRGLRFVKVLQRPPQAPVSQLLWCHFNFNSQMAIIGSPASHFVSKAPQWWRYACFYRLLGSSGVCSIQVSQFRF